jgi:hypothetical protein
MEKNIVSMATRKNVVLYERLCNARCVDDNEDMCCLMIWSLYSGLLLIIIILYFFLALAFHGRNCRTLTSLAELETRTLRVSMATGFYCKNVVLYERLMQGVWMIMRICLMIWSLDWTAAGCSSL